MNRDDRDRDSVDRWVVRGLLFADNRFERLPGFTIADVPATDDRESPLRAELLDSEGHVVLRVGIPRAVPCADGPGADPSFRLASGVVPLPAKAAAARFLVDDVVVEEYRFPEGEPVTAFTALPADGASGRVTVAWESRHPSDTPLTSVASYSSDDGASWQPLGLPTDGSEVKVEVDLDALAGGERCRVSVKTTDGVHTVTTVSEPFKLELRPCVAMILAPGPGLVIAEGETLHLQGQGYWLEEREPEFEALFWSSSLAGALGSGPVADVVGLEEGTHEITLEAGEGDRAGRATVEVVVTPPSRG
ncbi:hypothetical protein BH18ACT14_BH18ACT14_08140 [soil metagenome]